MKRILGEVSVKDFDGCLRKIMELLENKELGHYYLHELGQFLHKAPTKVLHQTWLNELSSYFVWRRAEDHFKKTKRLWYNELEWPFQICVLEIGGIDNETLRKKWLHKYAKSYWESKLTKDIDNLDLSDKTKTRKIYLIRLQPECLGLHDETPFSQINCDHPKFNLSLCPQETAFLVRPLMKEYSGQRATIFAADFKPADTFDDKKRVFWVNGPRDVYMNAWDIAPNNTGIANNYWIFQYNQTVKK